MFFYSKVSKVLPRTVAPIAIFLALLMPVSAISQTKKQTKTEKQTKSENKNKVEVRTSGKDTAVVSQVVETKGNSNSGKVFGPGGKPLRSDYPGTERSLKPISIDGDEVIAALADKDRDERAFSQQIQQVQTEIDQLREGVLNAKARIALLNDTLLREKKGESRTHIVFENQLGTLYKLNRLMVSLDGDEIFNQEATEKSPIQRDSVEIFSGVPPHGTHQLSISATIAGDAVVFTYFNHYSMDVNFSCTFDSKGGTFTYVTVTTENNGELDLKADKKPALNCHVAYRTE